MMVIAEREGLKVEEVPIVFVDRFYGVSKLGSIEVVRYLRGLVRLYFEG